MSASATQGGHKNRKIQVKCYYTMEKSIIYIIICGVFLLLAARCVAGSGLRFCAVLLFGRLFVKRFALRPTLSDRCLSVLSCLPVLSVRDIAELWTNGWMDQGATWYAGRPRPRPHCVRWGPSSPSSKGAQPPIPGPCLLWPNGWMVKMPLSTEVGLGPGHIVLDRNPTPPTQKGHSSPHFSAHVFVVKRLDGLGCHLVWR